MMENKYTCAIEGADEYVMRKKGFARLLCVLLILSGIVSAFIPKNTNAEDTRKIRVGFYQLEGYQEMDEEGNPGGYGYEYLQKLAQYTGWEYELVEGSWNECLEMLKSGEIDLLGGIMQNDERMEELEFARLSSGTSLMYLLSKQDAGYHYEDFEAFDGMTVGELKGDIQNQVFTEYCSKNNFSVNHKIYNSTEEMCSALEQGEVDAILVSIIGQIGDYSIIGKVSAWPFYFAVAKGDTELLTELNEGMEQIYTKDSAYNANLYDKYYANSMVTTLTKEEESYIESSGEIQVALYTNFPTISYYNKNTDTFTGTMPEVFGLISERTGLQFTFIPYDGSVTGQEYFEQTGVSILAPVFRSELTSLSPLVRQTNELIDSKLVMLVRKGTHITFDSDFIIALPKTYFSGEKELKREYSDAQIVYCDDVVEAISMVRNGRVDATFADEIYLTYHLQSPYNEQLEILSEYSFRNEGIFIVSGSADERLLTILNKAINSLHSGEMNQIIVEATMKQSYKLKFDEWLYEYRYMVIMFTLFGCAFVVLLRLLINNRRNIEKANAEKRILEERQKTDLKYQKKLFQQANFDSLTGMYTRNYFIQKAQAMVDENPDMKFAIVYINVDNFKLINNMFCWSVGNEALKSIAGKIRHHLNNKGVYGRIHADEFVVLVPGEGIEDKIVISYSTDKFIFNDQTITITYKVGICKAQEDGVSVENMMERALMALKSIGKSATKKIGVYDEKLLETLLQNQEIIEDMENALETGQFKVFLQPQYNIKEKKVIGAEALVRWFHPEKGMISPGKFIPVFEHNGFITKLDSYIWEQVCMILQRWKEQYHVELPISVNVSRTDVFNADWEEIFENLVKKYNIPPSLLHLEITETAYMDNQHELIAAGEKLRDMGFTIAMDDFGSGYSSLNMLKDVPVDILKLDMRFLYSDKNSTNTGNILKAMVNMADWMSLDVIAEGVEQQEQADFLGSIGCEIIQGYLYGKPMPVEEFEEKFIQKEEHSLQ